jgi:hypothetical protein
MQVVLFQMKSERHTCSEHTCETDYDCKPWSHIVLHENMVLKQPDGLTVLEMSTSHKHGGRTEVQVVLDALQTLLVPSRTHCKYYNSIGGKVFRLARSLMCSHVRLGYSDLETFWRHFRTKQRLQLLKAMDSIDTCLWKTFVSMWRLVLQKAVHKLGSGGTQILEYRCSRLWDDTAVEDITFTLLCSML